MDQLVIAGVSSMIAAACTNPIDVLKTRLQIDGAGLARQHQVHGGSFRQCARNVTTAEGVGALYRGVLPSLAREASYSSLRLGLYEPLKQAYVAGFPQMEPSSLLIKVAAGGTTGAIGSAIANPCDLIKVQQQSFTGPLHNDTPLRELVRKAAASRGVLGLWLGSTPTIVRAALLTAAQIPAYDHTKHALLNSGHIAEGNLLHFASSMVAGVVAALVTSPVDLAKTRIMNSCSSTGTGGVAASLLQVVRAEGPVALYKGFHAQWLRIGFGWGDTSFPAQLQLRQIYPIMEPHTTITLMIYESLRSLIGMDYL